MTDERQQRAICDKYGATYAPSPAHLKVGIALNVRDRMVPINGLRHPAEGDTTGWYIWAGGEPSSDPNFFQPLHVQHLHSWCPQIAKFLGLPPGWRFLVTDEHEDVWEDPTLLDL